MTRQATTFQLGDECAYGTLVRRTHDGQSWVCRRADGRYVQVSADDLVYRS